MSQREAAMLWMKDILEHLSSCQKQLEWADDDGKTICLLTESMLRDLERCQVLCQALHNRYDRAKVA
jgi:hypothetical protein